MCNEVELLNNFELLTRKNFTFLSTMYGFICTQEEKMGTRFSTITYENKKLIIKINFNTYTFEIGFYLSENNGRNIATENTYSIGDLISFYGAEKEVGFLAPQASSIEHLEIALSVISLFLKKRATLLLAGNKKEFQKLIAFIKSKGSQNLIKLKLDSAKSKVNEAWKNKRYADVVTFYEPLKNHLGETELAQLQYAKKHLK